MSRIIVKGLPVECDEARLRAHFSAGGGFDDISDVKVARTRAGGARRFGFVGFRGADTGARAVRHFDRSFMGAVRLAVEPAAAVGAATLIQRAGDGSARAPPGAARAAAAGAAAGAAPAPPGATARAATRAAAAALAAELGVGTLAAGAAAGVADKARLAEYLALARSRATTATWANDDALTRGARRAAPGDAGGAGDGAGTGADAGDGSDDGTDDDEYGDLPVTGSAGGGAAGGARDAPPQPSRKGARDKVAAVSDLDFLRSKVTRTLDSDDEGGGGAEEEEEDARV